MKKYIRVDSCVIVIELSVCIAVHINYLRKLDLSLLRHYMATSILISKAFAK